MESKENVSNEVRQLQDSTLDSTERSVQLIDQSLRSGQNTLDDLNSQGEQLKNIENNMNLMDNFLDESKKHIAGIRSIFGNVPNYFRKKSKPSIPSFNDEEKTKPEMQTNYSLTEDKKLFKNNFQIIKDDAREEAINNNLNVMSRGLDQLQMNAAIMNDELTKQNNQMERIINRVNTTGERIDGQNKLLNKI
ncbi:hypothetical protein SNEBB_001879 [Seison nebaliae]|nr:hypothetical protein SNEBB_001879 [Seison nebaliae]